MKKLYELILKEKFKVREFQAAQNELAIQEAIGSTEDIEKARRIKDKLHEELAYLHHEIELEKQKFYKSKGE
jgi:hypothetical protein